MISLKSKQIESEIDQKQNSKNFPEDENIMKYRMKLNDFLNKNFQCEDISIPLFHTFLESIPPIFIDIKVTIKSDVKLPKWSVLSSKLTSIEKNYCLSNIAKILNLKYLPIASHKSTKASTHIFW